MRSKYVEQTMSSGESLIYEAKLHWIVFRWVALVLFLFFIAIVSSPSSQEASSFIPLLLLILLLFGSPTWLTYKKSEFAVTNKRLVVKVGWISRRTLELNVDKIESASVDQGIMGRLFDYGTITFTGLGATKERFKKVANPFGLRAAVMEAMGKHQTKASA